MKYFKYLPIAALLSMTAFAATPNEEAAPASQDVVMEKPSLFASQSRTVSAVVEAIDHETRVVTVRKPDGEAITFTASEEVRNLPLVLVGDVLVAEYVESLSIEVASDGRGEGEPFPGRLEADQAVILR